METRPACRLGGADAGHNDLDLVNAQLSGYVDALGEDMGALPPPRGRSNTTASRCPSRSGPITQLTLGPSSSPLPCSRRPVARRASLSCLAWSLAMRRGGVPWSRICASSDQPMNRGQAAAGQAADEALQAEAGERKGGGSDTGEREGRPPPPAAHGTGSVGDLWYCMARVVLLGLGLRLGGERLHGAGVVLSCENGPQFGPPRNAPRAEYPAIFTAYLGLRMPW